MAEFFRKKREKSTIRDAKHIMPVKQIPDLDWKFDENINQVETVETVPETICTTEASQETEEQQGKRSPCMPTSPGSTPNHCPTATKIQITPIKEKAQILSTAEQDTQITPTTEQAIQTTISNPPGKQFPCS